MAPSAAAVASAPAPQDARLGWQGPGGTTTPLLGSRLVHKLHNWPWRTGWMARPCPVSAGVGGLGGGATKGSSPRGEKWRRGGGPAPSPSSSPVSSSLPPPTTVGCFLSLLSPQGPRGLRCIAGAQTSSELPSSLWVRGKVSAEKVAGFFLGSRVPSQARGRRAGWGCAWWWDCPVLTDTQPQLGPVSWEISLFPQQPPKGFSSSVCFWAHEGDPTR